MSYHTKTFHSLAIFHECKFCTYKTIHKGNLKKHIDATHSHQKFTCEICQKQVASNQSLKQHKRRVHFSEQQPKYDCNICTYQSLYKHDLKSHIEKIHIKLGTFHGPKQQIQKCDLCPYVAKHDCALRLHKDRLHKNFKNKA